MLDLANVNGVLCSKLLADMGADVIKIEKPGGDATRQAHPFAKAMAYPLTSLFFFYHNTNKRGITLNLENPRGQDIFRQLVQTADVIVETFPPGYLAEFGLGYEALREINSKLIVASITDFGQTGLYKHYKSCSLVASALGGQMYVCGDQASPPLKPYGDQPYLTASLFAAIGIMTALRHRHLSGEGQYIDISVHESVAATIEHVLVRYYHEGIISRRQGNLHWNNAFRVFRCQDGFILISPFQQWDTLVEWMDSEGMAADLKQERWHDSQVQVQEIDHIFRVLEKWTQTHTVSELVQQAQLMRLPWGPVDSLDKVTTNPQLSARGFFVETFYPEIGHSFAYPGTPYRLSASPRQMLRRPPLVGEHNDGIYCEELGFSQSTLAELKTKGIV